MISDNLPFIQTFLLNKATLYYCSSFACKSHTFRKRFAFCEAGESYGGGFSPRAASQSNGKLADRDGLSTGECAMEARGRLSGVTGFGGVDDEATPETRGDGLPSEFLAAKRFNLTLEAMQVVVRNKRAIPRFL